MSEGKDKGTATRFANELQIFFEDSGSVLWTTFVGERFYWGFAASHPPKASPDGDGVWRAIRDGWRCVDIEGELLTKDRLSGTLTKLAAYRGTSCDVDVSDYVVRRINGKKTPEVENALVASVKMKATAALDLMRLLGPRDFELLVDLVFTTSGWRRVGVLGKTQKTLDLDLVLPSTSEAFVQVKSKTTSAELAEYVGKIDDGTYGKMFFVFHSGEAQSDDPRVSVIGPEKLAELVLDAGLVSWLIRKVS